MKMRASLPVSILALAIFTAGPAFAEDAAGCVKIGQVVKARSSAQSLTNTCGRKIEVIWCHKKAGKPYRRGVCGRNGKFYQKHGEIKPGQTISNPYTLPTGTRIYYGACFGGYYTAKQVGMEGKYGCKNRK